MTKKLIVTYVNGEKGEFDVDPAFTPNMPFNDCFSFWTAPPMRTVVVNWKQVLLVEVVEPTP